MICYDFFFSFLCESLTAKCGGLRLRFRRAKVAFYTRGHRTHLNPCFFAIAAFLGVELRPRLKNAAIVLCHRKGRAINLHLFYVKHSIEATFLGLEMVRVLSFYNTMYSYRGDMEKIIQRGKI